MVEGVSEEVYFNRIAMLSETYSLSIKVSKDKDCMGIINNCARESKRLGLEEGDLKAAVFDLDVVDRKTLEEAKKKAEKENILLLTTNLSFELEFDIYGGNSDRFWEEIRFSDGSVSFSVIAFGRFLRSS